MSNSKGTSKLSNGKFFFVIITYKYSSVGKAQMYICKNSIFADQVEKYH